MKPIHHSEAVKKRIDRTCPFLSFRLLSTSGAFGSNVPDPEYLLGFLFLSLTFTFHIGVNGAHWLPVGLIFQPFVYYEIRLGGLDVFC